MRVYDNVLVVEMSFKLIPFARWLHAGCEIAIRQTEHCHRPAGLAGFTDPNL